ncbi:MAG: PqqD family protein [Pyrinomonadaceae bacterium]|nr:PqqD family protein [Pyrinomonadaceae bacterium]
MNLNSYPLSRKDNLVVQESADEVLLYDFNSNRAYCLNETSAVVWELCDGKSSVADINQKLSQKLNQQTSEELVWLALDQLKKEKLLSNHEEIKIDYKGLSRRDAIRKVGIASLVALPLILSLHTPVAATASSVCGVNFMNPCQCFDPACGIAGLGTTNVTTCTDSCDTQSPGGGACLCRVVGCMAGVSNNAVGTCG